MTSLPLDCCVCLNRIDFRKSARAVPGCPGTRVCGQDCYDRLRENLARDLSPAPDIVAMLTATISDQRMRAEAALNIINFENLDAAFALLMVRDLLEMIVFPPLMSSPRPTADAAKGGA